MSDDTPSSCPQCGSLGDFYLYCLNCGYYFAGSDSRLHDSGSEPEPLQPLDSTPMANGAASPPAETPASAEPRIPAESPAADGPPVPDEPPPAAASVEPARVRTQSTYPDVEESPRTGTWVAVGAAALLIPLGFVAASNVGALVGDQPDRVVDTSRTTSTGAPSPSSSTPATSPSTTAGIASSPSATPTCWNGDPVPAVGLCGRLTGRAGLAWVYPGLDSTDGDCFDDTDELTSTSREIGRKLWLLAWECEIELPSGEAEIYFSSLSSAEDGLRWYDEFRYEGKATTEVINGRDGSPAVTILRRQEEADEWALTAIYTDHPWAVSIEAPTKADRERLFERFGQGRSPAELDAAEGS
jgi:hypothetical protein